MGTRAFLIPIVCVAAYFAAAAGTAWSSPLNPAGWKPSTHDLNAGTLTLIGSGRAYDRGRYLDDPWPGYRARASRRDVPIYPSYGVIEAPPRGAGWWSNGRGSFYKGSRFYSGPAFRPGWHRW
ncbi:MULTISPECIES: hypothetical protein [Filomicrobium]|uniref:hypothetical protein n=1 Tax=Filomicrobium TaxID=119044 RepID=UPI00062631E2|nr:MULTISPECIES: hypothetical protein [Filomicrobium]MCV0370098.1 hypothetical protein [Filomicrobium sp.]